MKKAQVKISFLTVIALEVFLCCSTHRIPAQAQRDYKKEIVVTLRQSILAEASWALQQMPITVTAVTSPRSAGDQHDFYSEGDYWWPDPEHPNGPYIQRDGLTNPDNFTAHRKAMIRFSKIVGALVSAWKITKDEKYVKHAVVHLRAWFVDADTRMNPSLAFAQAIQGKVTGRSIGIIDTIQLMEVAQGTLVMMRCEVLDDKTSSSVKKWFTEYVQWLMHHPYGVEEMQAKNNHGTCWVMQVAVFAKLIDDASILTLCRERYQKILLPEQMALDGSFPLELKRTKPYGYSIFNLDAMVVTCHVLSTREQNLWNYKTSDGRTIKKAIEFLAPYLADKTQWPYAKDVMYWDNWPVAQPSLLFGALAFDNADWFNSWVAADHQPTNDEVIRNLPIRHPLLWIE